MLSSLPCFPAFADLLSRHLVTFLMLFGLGHDAEPHQLNYLFENLCKPVPRKSGCTRISVNVCHRSFVLPVERRIHLLHHTRNNSFYFVLIQ